MPYLNPKVESTEPELDLERQTLNTKDLALYAFVHVRLFYRQLISGPWIVLLVRSYHALHLLSR